MGHLIIANTMLGYTDLDQMWFVVSPHNPFKNRKSLLPDLDRLRMVELAIEDNFDLRASNIEFDMPIPSYTIDTLIRLVERYPQHDFRLVIGEDNLTHFHKWKNYGQIMELAGLYVYPRPHVMEKKIKLPVNELPEIVKINEAPMIDISATFIRKCVKNHVPIRYLVHDRVAEYISDRKLFL